MRKNSVKSQPMAFSLFWKLTHRHFIAWAYFFNIQLMIFLNFYQRVRLGCRYGKAVVEEELIIEEELLAEV